MNIGRLKLSLRERILLGSIMAALFPLFYYLGHVPQQKRLKNLWESHKSENAKVSEQQTILQDLKVKNTAGQLAALANQPYNKYLETSTYLSNLLRKLGTQENQDDLKLKVINIDEYKKVNNFYRSSFKLEVETSFIALGKFLASLEKAEVLIEVRSLSLNRIDADLRRCNATIEVFGYYNGDQR